MSLARTLTLAALLALSPVLVPAGFAEQAPAPLITRETNNSLLDVIRARGVLKVGLTGDYKPFSFLDQASGKFTGLDVDMAHALAKAMGVKLAIVHTTWSTMMHDMLAGKFDIAMGGVTITLPRMEHAYFSIPVMKSGKTAIARCTDEKKYQTLAEIDRPGVRVIVNPGGTNESFDEAHFHHAKIVLYPSNVTIFEQLVKGDADVMITDAVETRLQHKLHPKLCAIHPAHPFTHSELGYMMPRDVTLKFFVDEWLNEMNESGQHAKIVKKWLP